jgi:DNA polymerase-3 subunit delta
MKLSKDAATAFFSKPDAAAAGLLIYGPDTMRVALKRQEVVRAMVGPEGEEEMRFSRMTGAELRKDPTQLLDAIKAVGFFPGPRAVLVEEANENCAPAILSALEAWQSGDAQIVVTAGQLKPTSKLRKGFEQSKTAYAAAIYNDPPGRAEIEKALTDAGVSADGEALAELQNLARMLEPGDFRQTLEKLAIYKLGDTAPVSAEDIDACAPRSIEAQVDDILMVVADGQVNNIGPVMQRLVAQGANPTTLCIGAMRHFRTLHRAAADTSGKPQIWGPNRDRMMRQASNWGVHRLEDALGVLTDTDLSLRSAGATAPAAALVERAFIRLAMLSRK